mmetsp:Transcript_66932/g.160289  ORF Transcript_66932/g.160289 Transcript_66932/m.160289 type:complete len:401 (-) Transcript_66932:163-1365(-)
MKRRIQGLAASTSKPAKKWRVEEEDDDDDEAPPAPPPEPKAAEKSQPAPPPPPAAEPPADPEDDELWDELEEAVDAKPRKPLAPKGNPVVWMDISVAGKPHGRVFLELFKDVVPQTAENFRRLCLGVRKDSRLIGYSGSEIHKVIPGKFFEGGEFEQSADGGEFEDENFLLRHSKGGLLTMANDGPNTNSSRFQVTLKAQPSIDGFQVVFGQLLADRRPDAEAGSRQAELHPLYWVASHGTSSGKTLEAVVIEECGECEPEEAALLLGQVQPKESQEARYARSGLSVGRLEDAITKENIADVLSLTADVTDLLEWEAKKVDRAEGQEKIRKSAEVEMGLKAISGVLEEAEYKAGDVQGPDGKQGRKAKSQLNAVRDILASMPQVKLKNGGLDEVDWQGLR